MEAKELRIGNWFIAPDGDNEQVFAIEFEPHKNPNPTQYLLVGRVSWDLEKCSPIPLTPEILEKCGFIKEENDAWRRLKLPILCEGQLITMAVCEAGKGEWVLMLDGYSDQGADGFEIAEMFKDIKREDYPKGIGYVSQENSIAMRHLSSLHQLQNLFFAVTEEELEFNLPP